MSQRSLSSAPVSLAQELRRGGPTLAHALRLRSGLAPATFTRAMAALRPDVLAVGATRSLTYALRRKIVGLPNEIPIYELAPAATSRFATLHPIEPAGFYLESPHPVQGFYPDLPWFLHDLRPAGFLGRLAPRQHPELGLPTDIQIWTADHTLRWLHEWGIDGVGSFVIGDPAFGRLQEFHEAAVPAEARCARYPQLASQAMSRGVPGSSAGGEQPKFLATRQDRGRQTPVLVKFSPPTGDPAGRRTADLLRCEHHALVTLRSIGISAATSVVVEGGGRVFLEVERFDRVGQGRLGLVSLLAVAAHSGADIQGWAAAADDLVASRGITPEDRVRIELLDRFGELIGNTDRHAGNLSFFFDAGRVGALAPVYDMLPMRYAVRAGEFTTPPLMPPAPTPRSAAVWRLVWSLAVAFWDVVASDAAIHDDLRRIASANAAVLVERRGMLERLPVG